MTQSDILYWFPQLCKNQEPVPLSENQIMTSVHGVQFVETSTYQWPGDYGGWYKTFEETVRFRIELPLSLLICSERY